jgi:hypothetical protein
MEFAAHAQQSIQPERSCNTHGRRQQRCIEQSLPTDWRQEIDAILTPTHLINQIVPVTYLLPSKIAVGMNEGPDLILKSC